MTRIASVPNIDIRPDHWDIVRDILQKHVPHYAVWAFGSRAKWTAKQYSDLDLAIITDKPLSLDTSASLADDFSESDLPWKVDIVDWASTSESFKEIIERDKVVVQEMARGLGVAGELATFTLEDCLEALIDYRGKTPRKTDAGIPLITAKVVKSGRIERPAEFIAEEDYEAWMSRGFPKVGDIVLTTEAPLGEVAQIKSLPVALAQRIVTLRGKPGVLDNGYLLYLLQSEKMQAKLVGRSSGTTVVGIKQSELRKIELMLPPIQKQRAIAHILGTLDDKIDVNRCINQTLETMAQAIFKSWFVDFDPVKAKIAAIEQGQDPLRAAMCAISGKTDAELDQMPREQYDQLAATALLFPDAMEDSELGGIPKGWGVSTIGEMVETAGGATPDTKNESYWNPPEHFWTSPKDLSGVQSPVLLATERKISTVGLSRIGSGLLPKGTLLMSSRAPIGYLAITQIPVAINQGYIAMLPGGKLPPLYLLMWCQQNMEEIKGQANGSTFMEISKKAFRPMLAIYPGSNLMEAFVEVVTPAFDQIVARVKESNQLSDLRDILLPKLLSGELRVPGIERITEEV